MPEILKAIFLGIVEGITEWLPISSTGHMLLINEFLKLDVSEEFLGLFMVVIQIGAIFAVLLMYWNRIFPLEFSKNRSRIVRRPGRDRYGNKIIKKYRKTTMVPMVRWDVLSLWFRILVACIPAIVIGLPFDDLFERLFYKPVPIALALIIFGAGFIAVEIYNARSRPYIRSAADIPLLTAFIIGIFQLIAAIFPGTSRSGATILGAIILGVSRTAAAEFTFYMSIPVMFGAGLLKVLKFIISGNTCTLMEVVLLLVGMITAFFVSLVVIRLFMGYIKRNDFKVFGYYRIVLGLIVLAFFLIRT